MGEVSHFGHAAATRKLEHNVNVNVNVVSSPSPSLHRSIMRLNLSSSSSGTKVPEPLGPATFARLNDIHVYRSGHTAGGA